MKDSGLNRCYRKGNKRCGARWVWKGPAERGARPSESRLSGLQFNLSCRTAFTKTISVRDLFRTFFFLNIFESSRICIESRCGSGHSGAEKSVSNLSYEGRGGARPVRFSVLRPGRSYCQVSGQSHFGLHPEELQIEVPYRPTLLKSSTLSSPYPTLEATLWK